MTNGQIFSLCNMLAMAGWITLIFLPFWKRRDQYVFSVIIILFAIIYSGLMLSIVDGSILKSYRSLPGVSNLFENSTALLAGWVHYLAFDLLAGIYIIRDGAKNGLNHWLLTPSLLLTFLFGPLGLLLYFLLRWIKTKKLFLDL
jgi:hypothetical protein